MKILYGGAFNPPTMAHLKIVYFLLEKFKDATIVLLPTNDFYNKNQLAPFADRMAMLGLMAEALGDRVTVSDYENTQTEFQGTYFTLRHFDHPYFVLGADAFRDIEQWIRFPDVAIENNFLILPRDGINIAYMVDNHPLLHEYQDNFILLDDFKEMKMSSTTFRKLKDKDMVLSSVYQYIKHEKLYEVK